MSGYKTRPINLDQYKGAFVWVDAIISELEDERLKVTKLRGALNAIAIHRAHPDANKLSPWNVYLHELVNNALADEALAETEDKP